MESDSESESGEWELVSHVLGVDGDANGGVACKLKRSMSEGASNVDLGVDCPQDGVKLARGLRVYSLSMKVCELGTIQFALDVGCLLLP